MCGSPWLSIHRLATWISHGARRDVRWDSPGQTLRGLGACCTAVFRRCSWEARKDSGKQPRKGVIPKPWALECVHPQGCLHQCQWDSYSILVGHWVRAPEVREDSGGGNHASLGISGCPHERQNSHCPPKKSHWCVLAVDWVKIWTGPQPCPPADQWVVRQGATQWLPWESPNASLFPEK